MVPSAEPVRTCIGCRRRDLSSSLLRMVADARPSSVEPLVRPDLTRRLPGRGAWIHPTLACLEQAQRRRAFTRALRLRTGADLTELRIFVETWESDSAGTNDQHATGTPSVARKRTESGFDADESPMSTQQ